MTGMNRIADEVVTRLLERDLFTFDKEALGEIDAFYAEVDAEQDPLAVAQGLALSTVNAAEFALIPALTLEQPLMPDTAVHVDLRSARLSLMKSWCNLIFWTHAIGGGQGVQPLTVSDLMVFGGDASKLTKIVGSARVESGSTEDMAGLAETLESAHISSPWYVAEQVGQSGVLRLQGLLWSLKNAVLAREAEQAIAQTVDAFRRPNPA
jgi:hypothetical protein